MLRVTTVSIFALFFLVNPAFAVKTCPNCGQEYPDDCNFCEECVPPTRLPPSGMKLISIPGGTFSWGSTAFEGYGDERPVYTVTVSDFKLSETEVTFAQYVEFLNAVGPSNSDRGKWVKTNDEDATSHIYYSGGKYYADPGWGDHPVVNVAWYGAGAFCEYYGLRLPTQAEWEYAAGGPNHYKYPWGDEFDGKACCYSCYNGSGDPPTMSVKSFEANGYGLYEMAGNVWEWCSDLHEPGSDPELPSTHGVARGGSWEDGAQFVLCASRFWIGISLPITESSVGFRAAGD
jgi:sulfatase modifying factor 1